MLSLGRRSATLMPVRVRVSMVRKSCTAFDICWIDYSFLAVVAISKFYGFHSMSITNIDLNVNVALFPLFYPGKGTVVLVDRTA